MAGLAVKCILWMKYFAIPRIVEVVICITYLSFEKIQPFVKARRFKDKLDFSIITVGHVQYLFMDDLIVRYGSHDNIVDVSETDRRLYSILEF